MHVCIAEQTAIFGGVFIKSRYLFSYIQLNKYFDCKETHTSVSDNLPKPDLAKHTAF